MLANHWQPFYPRGLKPISIGLLHLMLIGCSLTPEFQQGNIINTNQAKKIQIGTSQAEVLAWMGQPLLVHPLNDTIWIYVYQKGNRNSSEIHSQHLIVEFNEVGRVTNIDAKNLDFIAPENDLQ